MAFEQIEVQSVKSVDRASAAVTLSRYANSNKAATTTVSLRSDIVTAAGFGPKSTFKVFLGRDDDAGKLRLVEVEGAKVAACFMKRTNAFFVRLGVIRQIGIAPCPRTPTEARVIEKGTVEVDIPMLVPSIDDDAAQREPASPDGAAASPEGKKDPFAEVFYNGITIDFADGEETITFDGEGIAVSQTEAKLVALLARPRPSPVAESFLIKNLWNGSAPKNATEQLREFCTGDLKHGLAKIGLDLRFVKGAGYQLKDC